MEGNRPRPNFKLSFQYYRGLTERNREKRNDGRPLGSIPISSECSQCFTNGQWVNFKWNPLLKIIISHLMPKRDTINYHFRSKHCKAKISYSNLNHETRKFSDVIKSSRLPFPMNQILLILNHLSFRVSFDIILLESSWNFRSIFHLKLFTIR